MGISPIPRTPVLRPWFNRGNRGIQLPAGATLAQYATFLDEFDYMQIDRENLLKAPDDLTNTSYWTPVTNLTITDQSEGVFRLDKTGGGAHQSYVYHDMINWFPAWAGEASVILEVRAGTIDEIDLTIADDSGNSFTAVEKISGSGTATLTAGRLAITGLDSGWSKFRGSGSVKGWSTVLKLSTWPDAGNSNTGYLEVRNVQIILGDQSSEKPRPVAQETAYPMMAYRPNWRLTKDGSARTFMTDTEGLIWCGEATDIQIAPGTTDPHNSDVDFESNVSFTHETGKYILICARYTDGNNYVGWLIAGENVQLRKRVGGDITTLATATGVLTDGVLARIRFTGLGTSLKIYVDDKLELSEVESDHLTIAGGATYHDLVSNDIRLVTESNPKAAGLIVADGRSVVADPAVHYTQPDGSAIVFAAGAAMLITLTPWNADRECHWGLDNNLVGYPLQYAGWKIDHNKVYIRQVLDDPGGSVSLEVERSFMSFLRSDTHGVHFFDYQSGKEWKLLFVGEDAVTSPGYPMIYSHDLGLSVTRIALLDLSSWVDRDFVEVLASDAAPIHDNTEVLAATRVGAAHVQFTMTRPDPITGHNFQYLKNGGTLACYVGSYGGDEAIEIYDYGDSSVVVSGSPAVEAGTTKLIDMVVEADGFTSLFVDNVLIGTGTLSLQGRTFDRLITTLGGAGEEQTDLSVHPYPALGLATGQIVCPQLNDTAAHKTNVLSYLRATQRHATWDRDHAHRYTDGDDFMKTVLFLNGTISIKDRIGGSDYTKVTTAVGFFSDDDDISQVFEDTFCEIFVNGVSGGSSDIITGNLTAANGFKATQGIAGGADAAEFWPRLPKLPFKL